MTWKLTTYGKTCLGVPGVPWRDLTDEEFAEAEALFEPGVLRAREYFEHVPDVLVIDVTGLEGDEAEAVWSDIRELAREERERQIASAETSPYFEHEAAEAAPEPAPAPRARQTRSKR